MSFPSKRGVTLVAVIILIVFIAITVSGITVFIVQSFSQVQIKGSRMRALYLAQAGVQNAVYNFRVNGTFSSNQPVYVTPGNYFVIGGGDAGFLMVDSSAVVITGRKKENLEGFVIQNVNSTRSITIDRMIIQWDDPIRAVKEIRIDGTRRWRGRLDSPADIDIDDTIIAPAATSPTNVIRFDKDMSGVSYIDVQFVMTDGSTRDIRIYPASDAYSFAVSATGKVAGSNMYRTIRAEYDALNGKIVDYDEINSEMLP